MNAGAARRPSHRGSSPGRSPGLRAAMGYGGTVTFPSPRAQWLSALYQAADSVTARSPLRGQR